MRYLLIIIIILFVLFGCNPNEEPTNPEPETENIGYLFGGSLDDEGKGFLPASDGGYWVIGNTRSYGAGERDIWLIKLDGNFSEQWSKTFGSIEDESVQKVILSSENGLIISGHSGNYEQRDGRVFLKKIDPSGNEVWSKTYSDGGWDVGGFVNHTSDGGYIISGSNNLTGDQAHFWLIKTDPEGNEIWSKTYGGTGSCSSNSVIQTSDGGYIMYGEGTWDGSSDYNVWQGVFVKTDENGNEIWHNTYGGSGFEEGYGCAITSDGGYVGVGFSSNGGYIVKTDPAGIQVWFKHLSDFAPLRVYSTNDGEFLLCGRNKFAKLDSNGNTIWTKSYNPENFSINVYSLFIAENGELFSAGYGEGEQLNGRDLFVIRTDPNGNELR